MSRSKSKRNVALRQTLKQKKTRGKKKMKIIKESKDKERKILVL